MGLLQVVLVAAVLGCVGARLRPKTSPLLEIMQDDAKRAALCERTGFGCSKNDPKETLARYEARHGRPQADDRSPVILFPGLAGSGLECEIDKNYAPAWNCFKEWTWWGIWVNLYEALAQTCWFDNLAIIYEDSNNTFRNHPGVEIKPRDFGGLNGVNKLDHFDDPFDLTAYYQDIIDALLAVGYEPGKDLYGAPYDWRLPVDYLYSHDIFGTNQTFEQDVIDLVEKAFNATGKRVSLITHSMGGPTVLYFLNRRPLEWKETYIENFVPIAGPWAGTLKALKTQVSGDNMGLQIPLIDLSLLSEKDIARNMRDSGGTSYLVPDADYYGDVVFVENKALGKNYTSSDFGQMWTDIGAPKTAKLWDKTKDLISDMVHPQVNAYCLYGYGKPTEVHLTYDKPWPTDPNEVNQPVVDYSDMGDGTIPLLSLVECKNWIKKENTTHQVNCKEYDLRGHTEILKDIELHLDLLEIVTGKSNITGCLDSPEFLQAVDEMKKYRK